VPAEPTANGVVGIVLAAGAGRRFGRPKAEVVVGDARLIDRAVATLRAGGCDPVIAVVRADTEVADATVVVNADPDRGMGSSLRLGLSAAVDTAAERAVVVLVDTPDLAATAVSAVAQAGDDATMARYRDGRGHPIGFARSVWAEVAAGATGDAGARAWLGAHPDRVGTVAVPGRRPVDLDTPEDLARWSLRS
jgi:CTP:molybdopterin cytidylyltransferase MocA